MEWLRSRGVIRLCQILIGLLFAWSGLAKLGDIQSFADQVHNFRIMPVALEHLVAMTLPWIELVASLALVLGIRARPAAVLVTLLLAVFTLGVAQAMVRGLDFECGCFGTADGTTVGFKKLGQNLVMLLVGWLASRRSAERF
jgi:putative oxidoreductase